MASLPASKTLTDLQQKVLRAFFARESGFFLTGGAALAGFHLGHRTTTDLDLFTLDDAAFERGRHVLGDLAAALDARLEVSQDAPGFLRVVLSTAEEGLVVDLVRERVHQIHEEKPDHGGIRVDPPDEILANKLSAIAGRAEERDLVDVLFLERAGYKAESALEAALAKDGGCTPATLAWVLSEIEIPDDIELPAGIAPAELRSFVEGLIKRLRRAALPESVAD
jgi:predicted nucleotidyltransferase component of viral defense system